MTARGSALLTPLGATALLVAGCGDHVQAGAAGAVVESSVAVSATFAEAGDGPAFTYDTALVPVGATAEVTSVAAGGATTTTLRVSGLVPGRSYGAHAHSLPCAAGDGAAAGAHYQFSEDPVTPSVDPAYANRQNEIWLDFSTDADGAAEATSTVPWTFHDDRRAAAVVIHEEPTATHAGRAGTAGARPACVTVEF